MNTQKRGQTQDVGRECRAMITLGYDAVARRMPELADAYADAAMRLGTEYLRRAEDYARSRQHP